MSLNNTTLRDYYLHDLEFTGDPEHGRTQKVRNIQHWKAITTPYVAAGGDPIQIDLRDSSRNVYVWSDIHWGHKNIMKYAGRPYPSTELMNQCLIGNYLNIVKPEDIVIFGGDIGFLSENAINQILYQLPGYKIQIIGNHDIHRDGKVFDLAFDERHLCMTLDTTLEQLLFTHYPLATVPSGCRNVHGHIHQHPAPSEHHVNICVEHTNYAPKLLIDALGY